MRIISFGDYNFPDAPIEFNTNFADLVPRTSRLPGMDGGYDEFGFDPAPQEIGNVTYGFLIRTTGGQALVDALDAARAMTRAGVRRLYLTTEGTSGTVRWTWARVNNVQTPLNHNEDGYRSRRVTVDWQVSDPRWFADFDDDVYGEGSFGTATFASAGSALAASGTATEGTVTRSGSAPVYPRIFIRPDSGGTVTNPTIELWQRGFLVESVALSGTAGTASMFTLDCQRMEVLKDGASVYDSLTAQSPWWFRLQPGDNVIRVRFGGTADAGTVRFAYHDAWY